MGVYCHIQNTHISNISSKIRNNSQVIEKNVFIRTSYDVTPSVHSYTATRDIFTLAFLICSDYHCDHLPSSLVPKPHLFSGEIAAITH